MYQHGGDFWNHPDFIDFSANINFLGAPLSVVQAAKSALDGICHYPQPDCIRLRQAVAELEHVKAEQILCGNGAAEIIFTLVLACKPKKALLVVPTFQEYEHALRSVDCEIVYEYLSAERGFLLQGLPAMLDHSIDIMFLCNPNNPTGMMMDREMMERLLQRCEQTDTLFVVDECFLDFVASEEETSQSMKLFMNQSRRLFVIKAFTKTFGIPGLRLGYGLSGNTKLLQKMQAVVQPWNVSILAQEAGIAAAGERRFLTKTRDAVEEEKRFLLEQLSLFSSQEKSRFFVDIYGSAANFIFFRSIPELSQMLKDDKILIRDCSNFPGLTQGWYRIAVRSREENRQLIDALHQIQESVNGKEFL